ncbi:response regulator transcription factor [Salipaludibacillus sp. CUR1]|uniref:response regulator transcription factor n=1 Tax=Salipaludibacillus sp. CUR1 TaxID=2820003 RepID=UPI001E28D85A|nr:response regulator transcription factor [Salipaludibacillus sp. CUR1]MCE7793082.1 response regulator transcription factor [Salipaludibacillus sp. CUR1]
MSNEKETTVLIVDDEETMLQLVGNILNNEGYRTVTAANGHEAINKMSILDINFVILDIMMPGMDGYETCQEIRKSSDVPILMLTAKTEEMDKVTALKTGADDYLVKPFGKNELTARIEAILRRTNSHSAKSKDTTVQTEWTFENITLNTESKKVTVDSKPVNLTKKEFEVLELLIKHPDQVFSREQLLDRIWGFEYLNATSRTVDTHMKTLRLKLKNAAPYIKTVWGMGYKLEVPE